MVREPSFSFLLTSDCDAMELPKVSTPTNEAPPALIWAWSGLKWDNSLFGASFGNSFSLSREQSREHFGFELAGPTDLAGPATNDTSVSEAETEACESISDDIDLLALEEPALQPQLYCNEPAQRPTMAYDAFEQQATSLKRKFEATEEAMVLDYCADQMKRPRKPEGGSMRGAHVRERPHMQQTARDGQRHWGEKVVELRSRWTELRMWEQHEEFHNQIKMCTRLHIKSQHECLLRQLQLALVEGLIVVPAELTFSADESQSFLGWTGFAIVPERGAEFRRRIEDMFAHPPQDKTLNNTLRRAGLVPQRGWGEAWSGCGAFVFNQQKRAHYSCRE